MLQNMRDLAKSWVFKTLMILLVISFGIWGIGDMFRGNPQQRTVAQVGKKNITVQELERNFQLGMTEARRVFGPDLSIEQAKQIGVMDRTLNLMIEQSLFNQEAKRLGLAIDDKTIMSQIASQPHLRDKDGKFNTELWHRLLNQNGFTERAFLAEEHKNALRRMIFDAVTANTLVPQVVINDLYQARGQRRILEVLIIDHAQMAGTPAPDDKTLQEFYQKNAANFTAPEYRSITIAKFSPADLEKDIHVSDEDLAAAYEARADEFTAPERRNLLQVIVQEEAKAKAIANTAQSTHNLDAAAKANGANAVPLNDIDEKGILPELYTTVFAMDKGQISAPVKSALGWHVIQVKSILPAGKLTFTEAKEKLRESIQRDKAGDAVARATNNLDDELAAGHALEDIADAMKLRLIKIPAVTVNGLTPDGKTPDELPAKEAALRAAYGQESGETSQMIDDGAGSYVIVRTDEITPSQTMPFEAVKDKVVIAWKSSEQAKQAAQKAEQIAKEIRDGKQATAFDSQAGVSVRKSKPISLLGDTDPELPPQAIPQILKMKKGDVITTTNSTRHYVLRLANLVPVDPSQPDTNRIKVVDDLNDSLPLDLIEQYSKALRQRLPVKINPELLDNLKKQGS